MTKEQSTARIKALQAAELAHYGTDGWHPSMRWKVGSLPYRQHKAKEDAFRKAFLKAWDASHG